MAKLLPEGVISASVIGCFAGKSGNKETPFFAIEFFTDEGTIDFIQYLTEKTRERAMETLINLGFMGKKVSDLANDDLAVGELFDTDVEDINITIEHEQVCDKEGNEKFDANGEAVMRHKVKWVNVGKSGFSKVDHKEAVVMFKGLNIDGELTRMRKARGVTVKKLEKPITEETAVDSSPSFDNDDVPF